MSTQHTKLNSSNDVEIGKVETTGGIAMEMSETSENCSNCCFKFSVWLLIMIFGFPLPFCDLYYGYIDNTCVSEPVDKLAINLKDYLLVNGWILMSLLGLISILIFFMDINTFNNKTTNNGYFTGIIVFSGIISVLIGIFLTIWNIIGAIIFWNLMDTTNCSNGIYNYVFTSLIIKLVCCVIALLQRKNENK